MVKIISINFTFLKKKKKKKNNLSILREYLDMRKNSYLILRKTPSYNKATTDKNPYFL